MSLGKMVKFNKEASYLAAFTPKDPNDKTAYLEKYMKHLADPSINMRTIKVNKLLLVLATLLSIN